MMNTGIPLACTAAGDAARSDRRDPGLPAAAREAVIAAITTESPAPDSPGPAAAAIALRVVLPDATVLTGGERRLLSEWLDRLAASRPSSPAGESPA